MGGREEQREEERVGGRGEGRGGREKKGERRKEEKDEGEGGRWSGGRRWVWMRGCSGLLWPTHVVTHRANGAAAKKQTDMPTIRQSSLLQTLQPSLPNNYPMPHTRKHCRLLK